MIACLGFILNSLPRVHTVQQIWQLIEEKMGPNSTPAATEEPFVVRPVTAFQPRKKIRVIAVEAGFSGLTLAYKLQNQNPVMQDFVSHTILEVRPDVGGTWLANVYPGVQCDVPAHVYVSSAHFSRHCTIYAG
jgi:hypothetical protein